MADNEKNKNDISTSWGDPAASFKASMSDDKSDFARDGAGIPNKQFAGSKGGPYQANNKFDIHPTFGDTAPSLTADAANDQSSDYAHDTAGVTNPDQGEKTEMEMTLAPNRFPRETGHDSLSPEEAQLS